MEAAQEATDETISKEVSKSGKAQTSLLSSIKDSKHKISLSEYQEDVSQAEKAYQAVVKSAQSGADAKIKAANDQHDKTIEALKKERDESGTISQSEYEQKVKDADNLRDGIVATANDMKDKQIASAKKTKEETVQSAKDKSQGVSDSEKTQSDNMIKANADAMSGTENFLNKLIDGVNWITKLFGGKGNFKHVDLTGHKDGLHDVTRGEIAVVGEEGFELAHSPSQGIYPVGVGGQEVRYLEPHTSILPHEMSKKFLEMSSGLPHYATGKGNFFENIISGADDLLDKIGGEGKKVWDIVSSGAGKAWEFLADKFQLKAYQPTNGGQAYKELGSDVFEQGESAAKSFLGGLISSLKPKMTSSKSVGASTGNWTEDIKRAAKALKFDIQPWQIQNMLKQIQTESGGNEKIVQSSSVVDVNTLSGNPAKGLLQFIPQTFAQWAEPGHTNIFSGYDQILAAIKRLNAMGTWNYIGQGHGWERGGFISRHGYYELGEGNNEEAIIPMNKGMRSMDMLYKTMNRLGVSREVKVEVPQGNSADKLLPVLLEILSAVKGSRNINMNVGDQIIQAVDNQLGPKTLQNNRLNLGGGTIG